MGCHQGSTAINIKVPEQQLFFDSASNRSDVSVSTGLVQGELAGQIKLLGSFIMQHHAIKVKQAIFFQNHFTYKKCASSSSNLEITVCRLVGFTQMAGLSIVCVQQLTTNYSIHHLWQYRQVAL